MPKRKARRYFTFGSRKTQNGHDFLASTRRLSMPVESLLPPKPASARTSLDKVLRMVQAHKEYQPSETVQSITDQPKLDDMSLYDVSDEQETRLWEFEAKRILRAVQDMSTGIEFKHYASFSEPDTEEAYENLSKLADQLLVNLHLCRYDNQVLLRQFSGVDDTWSYKTSQEILDDRLDNPDNSRALSREETQSRKFLERYCAMVDYITAVAARSAVCGGDIERWQTRVLAGLAKYSAKLKILARDSEEYIVRSLDRGKQLNAEKTVMRTFGISHMGLDSEVVKQPGQSAQQGKTVMPGQHFLPHAPGWHYHARDTQRTKELEA